MSDTVSAAAPESVPPPGFLQTLGGLYFSPREAFGAEMRRPRFWLPVAGHIVLSILFTAVWTSKVDKHEFMRAQIEASSRADRMTPEQKEQVIGQQVKGFSIFAWVLAVLIPPLTAVVLGGVYMLVFRFFYGGDVTFRQSLSIAAWTSFAIALVAVPLMLLTFALKGDWNINPGELLQANLSVLADKATTSKPLFSFLSSLDLFSFWSMFLAASGYAVLLRKSTTSALFGILALWALYVLVKVGLSTVF